MDCKKCGKPVAEGATFCGYCGVRVDGKIVCNVCGNLNDENFSYCTACGSRIDGKTVCAKCGTAFEGSFCPQCGTGTAEKTAAKKSSFSQATNWKEKTCRIFDIVSGGLITCGVLLAMIFTFFIGIQLSSGGGKMDLYDFFYEVYTAVKEINQLSMSSWFKSTTKAQIILYGIFGTLISCAAIITVTVFGIMALVKYAVALTGRKEDRSRPWAIACICCFFGSVALFLAHNKLLSSGNIDLEMTKATRVGVILCAIFLGLSVATKIVSRGANPWRMQSIRKTIVSLVTLLLSSVVFGLIQGARVGFSVGSVEMKGGFLMISEAVSGGIGTVITTENSAYYDITVKISDQNVFAIIGQVAVFCFAVFATLGIISAIRGVEGKNGKGLTWAICSFVSASVILVSNCVVLRQIKNIYAALGRTSFDGYYVLPILCLVFSALLLAANIARKIFAGKEK